MGTKRSRVDTGESAKTDFLLVPPGFASLTSFFIERVEEATDADRPVVVDTATLKESMKQRPWMLRGKVGEAAQGLESFDSERRDIEVHVGGDSENTKRCMLEEAPVFQPTEEEFSDSIKYLMALRQRAEAYGICRVIPPASWKPPGLLTKKNIWNSSFFGTQVQQIDSLKSPHQKRERVAFHGNVENAKQIGTAMVSDSRVHQKPDRGPHESGPVHPQCVRWKCGPEYSLETFKKFADDFQDNYFRKNVHPVKPDAPHEQLVPSVQSIECEYRQICEGQLDKVEVLCSDNIDTRAFGSGFPTTVDSGWNLNNLPRLSGSLLSFESCCTSTILVPRLHVGMCFATSLWQCEEHWLYSIRYKHFGAPTIWYGIPVRYRGQFEAIVQRYSLGMQSQQLKLEEGAFVHLSPAMLKSEGIPVFRCTQQPGEFVIILPGTYNSGLDCGFTCLEAVNVAPLDWLPYGQNAVELYREEKRKTSICHDKLLLTAAREAVRAQWKLTQLKRETPEDLAWKHACGTDGILTKALKSRVKWEGLRRTYLCNSSQSKKMDENFDASEKRECFICHYDLHLSAAFSSCSADSFSCLDHAMQLCACGWSNKFFIFRYEINELNLLIEALEGKHDAIYKWAGQYLGLMPSSSPDKSPAGPAGLTSKSASAAEPTDRHQTTPITKDSIDHNDGKIKARMIQEKSADGSMGKVNYESEKAGSLSLPEMNVRDVPSGSASVSVSSESEGGVNRFVSVVQEKAPASNRNVTAPKRESMGAQEKAPASNNEATSSKKQSMVVWPASITKEVASSGKPASRKPMTKDAMSCAQSLIIVLSDDDD